MTRMSSLAQNSKRWFVVVLLVSSIGTPWALLQSTAWISMLVKYSRANGFARAVVMTFDGKHPCRLCQLVQEGQAKERQQPQPNLDPEKKLDLGLPPDLSAFLFPSERGACFLSETSPACRSEAPPAPPPRLS